MLITILQTLYNNIVFAMGRLRAIFFGTFFKYCGDDVVIMKNFTFRGPSGISIGSGTVIGYNCFIDGAGTISIAENCLIAQNVSMFTSNHVFSKTNIPIKKQGYTREPIIIEEDVWIGANVILLPGITIGKGSVIGAGSIVTKNIAPWSIAVGSPAKIIKKRKK